MNHFPDDERSALNRRRQEIDRQLQALAAQKKSVDQTIYDERYKALLGQLHEVEALISASSNPRRRWA